ncbi:hypothetical protein [Cytobacillus oceanisediminis]|uniref:hypothetical protein n=1 Tax=Cytobacillus oceanisediminis TaxID=665099 RepID=UPI001C213789|nr:hypothetical protein [Cytobacillus oceanisediminis]MBU8769545.1 hypothetical protein [Cytobacillus oceanisediminis]
MRREAGGLSSLDANYEESIGQEKEILGFSGNIDRLKEEIVGEYENYWELYFLLYEELSNRNYDDIMELVSNFNRKKPLLELDTVDCIDKTDLVNEIFSLVHKLCYNSDENETDDMFSYLTFFELNNTLAEFKDFSGNQYRIVTKGDLYPDDGGIYTITLKLIRNNQKIEEGSISVNYGYIEFNEDGNVGDMVAEGIDIEISSVIEEIECI